MPSKTCTQCKTDKPFDEFPPALRSKDGLSSWCRECFCVVHRLSSNVSIPKDLYNQLRHIAIDKDISVRRLIIDILTAALEQTDD